jgi:periplasmic divalent cation tolerance protein
MRIAWTTVSTAADAETLASGAIHRNLAVCAQVDGPIHSHYRWEGEVQRAVEWRITFKYLRDQSPALALYVQGAHPYAVPEWIEAETTQVGEKYLSWARATRSPVNL